MTSQQLVLITDTNIWIDLGNGNLLDEVFRLPHQICIVDLARNEINSVDVTFLILKGLMLLDLTKDQVAEVFRLAQRNRTISPVDFAAFLLAKEMNAVLVSGDRNLVRFACDDNVSVHGLLWLMDEMVSCAILTKEQAVKSLKEIVSRGARLPEDECIRRYQAWSETD